jgi:hypothetical protein
MAKFDVHVFLIHCFIPQSVQVKDNIWLRPFRGTGVVDIADVIDDYLEQILHQPPQPTHQRDAMSNKIRDEGACVIVEITDLEAVNSIDAIRQTEQSLLTVRDIIAFRQLQRGYIAGFLTIQTDTDTWQLHSKVRRPYPILRKVQNLPIFESESDILANLFEKASNHPLLRIYLALYADAVAYSDTLITDVSRETRLMKTWSLLEAMALLEAGSKKQKVKALFHRYGVSTYSNYRGHAGEDLLDIAYKWRNVIAHCGGCPSATDARDKTFCRDFEPDFEAILEDLSQFCRMLLHAYAHSRV